MQKTALHFVFLRLNAVWQEIKKDCLVSKLPRNLFLFLAAWLISYEYSMQSMVDICRNRGIK